MKKLILASAIATLAFVPGAYAADSDSAVITLSASAPALCSLGTQSGGTAGEPASVGNTDSGTTVFTAAETVITFPGSMCNAKTTVTLASANGALTSENATDAMEGDFYTAITYIANASWVTDDVITSLNADNTGAKSAANTGATTAYNGDLKVTINAGSSTKPLVAGDYADTLTVTVATQI